MHARVRENPPDGRVHPDSGQLSPDDVLGAGEVAELFGLDRKTVYSAVRRREIPHKWIGRKLLFSRRALVEWWASQGHVVSDRK